MARVGVSQDIPNLAKRHAQQARADSDIKAAEADTAVEARSVEVGTALAWINLAYAQRRVAALDDLLSALERVVGTTQERSFGRHTPGTNSCRTAGHRRPGGSPQRACCK
jgi:outer membrane protein TolC